MQSLDASHFSALRPTRARAEGGGGSDGVWGGGARGGDDLDELVEAEAGGIVAL
jgi:hypothetical protein